MKIVLPSFTYPEPDPEDRFTAILPGELSQEARGELLAMHAERIKKMPDDQEPTQDKKPTSLDEP